MAYFPPHNLLYLQQNYPHLLKCPVHFWRAATGIELIHKEPSMQEQLRIWENWQCMSVEMKKLSNSKSLELFGLTNIQHHEKIMAEFYK